MLRTRLPVFLFFLVPYLIGAQGYQFPMQSISLNDLSAFKPAKTNWRVAGDVAASLDKDEDMSATKGQGLLVNLPDDKNRDNLVFNLEHGDLDLELDVMMARHSNSGIYLQGRYELQLLDSWGVKYPHFGDIGGIYQRWDERKPAGQEGYEGVPPTTNAALAPGLWQHLRIEFQAPRFDANGKKTTNARLIKVVLNGITVHENVELTGPTRGAAFPGEAPKGSILIQGDHGPVAFRNIRYRSYDAQPAQLTNLHFKYYFDEDEKVPDFSKLKMEYEGPMNALTWEVAKGNNDFALDFTGSLRVHEAGKYNITLISNGFGIVVLKGDTIVKPSWGTQTVTLDLGAGDHPIEIIYNKAASWVQPGLGLQVEGIAFRATDLHLPSSVALGDPIAPIFLNPKGETELLRCFMDIPTAADPAKMKRLVHPINVGYPDKISYTYDLDNGALVQAWRGDFLDATPMWDNRGDGHANPAGSIAFFGDATNISQSGVDTLPSNAAFHLLGYALDASGNPNFQYTAFGVQVDDHFTPQEDGKYLAREVKFTGNASNDLQYRLAKSNKIAAVSADTWVVGDRQYYIKVLSKSKPNIRATASGMQELTLPVGGSIQYSIIW